MLVTGPAYGLGTSVVGLIALVGAASVFLVPTAGRLIDRRGPDIVNLGCIIGVIAAAALLLTGLVGGVAGLVGLSAGMLLLDIAVQSSQVANQARIFALNPGARSRLNSVYMTSVFVGGSLGSLIATRIFVGLGWAAVCAMVAIAALVALVRHVPTLTIKGTILLRFGGHGRCHGRRNRNKIRPGEAQLIIIFRSNPLSARIILGRRCRGL